MGEGRGVLKQCKGRGGHGTTRKGSRRLKERVRASLLPTLLPNSAKDLYTVHMSHCLPLPFCHTSPPFRRRPSRPASAGGRIRAVPGTRISCGTFEVHRPTLQQGTVSQRLGNTWLTVVEQRGLSLYASTAQWLLNNSLMEPRPFPAFLSPFLAGLIPQNVTSRAGSVVRADASTHPRPGSRRSTSCGDD